MNQSKHSGTREGRISEALKGVAVKKKRPKGGGRLVADGGGLYCRIARGGTRTWVLLYHLAGKRREMGLGSVERYTVTEARDMARTYRKLVDQQIDPITYRDSERAANLAKYRPRPTFAEVTRAYIAAHGTEWTEDHRKQWTSTLAKYCKPINAMDVNLIGKADLVPILEPLRVSIPTTARKLRGRIEAVLTWAGARDDRLQPNDADMWSQIDASLPKRSKRAAKVRNHPAVPFAQIADVMRQIRETPRATEPVKLLAQWIALTACRTKEARHATWSEIDLKARTWSIPDEKMKAGRAHRVALSDEALAVLKRAKQISGESPLLFPIGKRGKMIAADTVLAMHHRIGYDFTVHGYRSAFRDWAYERTEYPRELIEQCIAHSVGDATELAYKRGDALDRRRALMNDWGKYCQSDQIHDERPKVEQPKVEQSEEERLISAGMHPSAAKLLAKIKRRHAREERKAAKATKAAS